MTASPGELTDLNDILTALNTYEAEHPADGEDYDPEGIWNDVIRKLPGFDEDRGDPEWFALEDGTEISYDPDPNQPLLWTAALNPGDDIPPVQNAGRPGFKVGECGHAVAGSEWRAGFRNCEHCHG